MEALATADDARILAAAKQKARRFCIQHSHGSILDEVNKEVNEEVNEPVDLEQGAKVVEVGHPAVFAQGPTLRRSR